MKKEYWVILGLGAIGAVVAAVVLIKPQPTLPPTPPPSTCTEGETFWENITHGTRELECINGVWEPTGNVTCDLTYTYNPATGACVPPVNGNGNGGEAPEVEIEIIID